MRWGWKPANISPARILYWAPCKLDEISMHWSLLRAFPEGPARPAIWLLIFPFLDLFWVLCTFDKTFLAVRTDHLGSVAISFYSCDLRRSFRIVLQAIDPNTESILSNSLTRAISAPQNFRTKGICIHFLSMWTIFSLKAHRPWPIGSRVPQVQLRRSLGAVE